MPTKHRRIAITETPGVKRALDELRRELGDERVPYSELMLLGARAKTDELRLGRERIETARRRLIERVLAKDIPGDPAAGEEVRRSGWARGE